MNRIISYTKTIYGQANKLHKNDLWGGANHRDYFFLVDWRDFERCQGCFVAIKYRRSTQACHVDRHVLWNLSTLIEEDKIALFRNLWVRHRPEYAFNTTFSFNTPFFLLLWLIVNRFWWGLKGKKKNYSKTLISLFFFCPLFFFCSPAEIKPLRWETNWWRIFSFLHMWSDEHSLTLLVYTALNL